MQKNLTVLEAFDEDIVESKEDDDKQTKNRDEKRRFSKRSERFSAGETSTASASMLSEKSRFSKNQIVKTLVASFLGKPLDGTLFGDLFTVAVIVNIVLQSSQTMQYLKSLLKGEAGELLFLIRITDHVGFKIFVNRYENEETNIQMHLDLIVSYRF